MYSKAMRSHEKIGLELIEWGAKQLGFVARTKCDDMEGRVYIQINTEWEIFINVRDIDDELFNGEVGMFMHCNVNKIHRQDYRLKRVLECYSEWLAFPSHLFSDKASSEEYILTLTKEVFNNHIKDFLRIIEATIYGLELCTLNTKLNPKRNDRLPPEEICDLLKGWMVSEAKELGFHPNKAFKRPNMVRIDITNIIFDISINIDRTGGIYLQPLLMSWNNDHLNGSYDITKYKLLPKQVFLCMDYQLSQTEPIERIKNSVAFMLADLYAYAAGIMLSPHVISKIKERGKEG